MSHLTPVQVEALAAGANDSELAAHLATCADCGSAVSDAKGRQRLLAGLTPYTLSDLAFRRVEARLSEQIELGGLASSGGRWRWWLVPIAAAAALVALAVVRLAPIEPRTVSLMGPVARVVPMEKARFHALTVIRASRDAKVRDGGSVWRAARPGEVLEAGAMLSGQQLVLAPAEVAWSFELSGSTSLGDQATVAVGSGALKVVVHGEALEVLAGGQRVIAREAAFLVSRVAAEVVLEVSQGEVEVRDGSSATRRVKAPARVRWIDGTPLHQGQLTPRAEPVVVAVPNKPWGVLDFSELLKGTQVSIDGQAYGTPLSAVLELGRHRVLVAPPGQPSQERWVELVGGGPSPFKLAPRLAPLGDREPDPQALALVMDDLRRQTPKLRACYEKWLKANPAAGGQVLLVLSVSSRGAVKRATVQGDPISGDSAACLMRTAKTLVLHPLGSEEELEVPLVFTPHGP